MERKYNPSSPFPDYFHYIASETPIFQQPSGNKTESQLDEETEVNFNKCLDGVKELCTPSEEQQIDIDPEKLNLEQAFGSQAKQAFVPPSYFLSFFGATFWCLC